MGNLKRCTIFFLILESFDVTQIFDQAISCNVLLDTTDQQRDQYKFLYTQVIKKLMIMW